MRSAKRCVMNEHFSLLYWSNSGHVYDPLAHSIKRGWEQKGSVDCRKLPFSFLSLGHLYFKIAAAALLWYRGRLYMRKPRGEG